MLEGIKKRRKKLKNKIISPCVFVGTRGRDASPSAGTRALGEEVFFPSVRPAALGEENKKS
jgi:hypothetical protein